MANRIQELECTDDRSENNTLATLPSFQGEYEAKIYIIPIPSSQQLILPIKDIANLQAILSAPITATLPLAEFLRVKPEMWDEVSRMLQAKGVQLSNFKLDHKNSKHGESTSGKIPVCRVSNYEQSSKDKGNTTLPVEVDGIKTMAILDTGAGISIATKSIWERWEK